MPLRSVIVTASYGALSFHLYVDTATTQYHPTYYALMFHMLALLAYNVLQCRVHCSYSLMLTLLGQTGKVYTK